MHAEDIKIASWSSYWEIQTFPNVEVAKQQKEWVIFWMRLQWHYHVCNMTFVTRKICEADPDFTRKYQFGSLYYSLKKHKLSLTFKRLLLMSQLGKVSIWEKWFLWIFNDSSRELWVTNMECGGRVAGLELGQME